MVVSQSRNGRNACTATVLGRQARAESPAQWRSKPRRYMQRAPALISWAGVTEQWVGGTVLKRHGPVDVPPGQGAHVSIAAVAPPVPSSGTFDRPVLRRGVRVTTPDPSTSSRVPAEEDD